MTQSTFASNATPSLPVLDQNFTQLYDLRELITTPAYTAAVTRLAVDATGSWMFGGATAISLTTPGVVLNAPAGATFGRILFVKGVASGTGATEAAAFFYNGVGVGAISCTSTATSFLTSSDIRLKRNIAPALPTGDLIDSMRVVSHDWVDEAGAHVPHGFVAQELAAVYPRAVKRGDDGEEIVDVWGVDHGGLVPLMVLELQQLRKRVRELEAAA